MATISNTPRPGYVWDSTDNVWYPIGVGGHAHPDYITQATAVNPTLIDAKGDIITATAADTPARLAVGNNGETLVADSSTSTGLRYQGSQAAGKNYQINGGFDNWQRSTSSSTINAYATADRWYQAGLGTVTYSRDTDVPTSQGFTYSAKWLTGASSSYGEWYSALESQDVNALAGRAVTLSYWIKSSGAYSGTATLELQLGTTANTLLSGTWSSSGVSSTVTPTGTWTKYQATGTITAGTVGLRVRQVLSTAQASGIGLFITGVQIELGSVATTFTRAGGTLQGELAACQRYYYRNLTGSTNFGFFGWGIGQSTSLTLFAIQNPVTMRTTPTVVEFSNLGFAQVGAITAITTLVHANSSPSTAFLQSDGTQVVNTIVRLMSNSSASGYLGIGAEL